MAFFLSLNPLHCIYKLVHNIITIYEHVLKPKLRLDNTVYTFLPLFSETLEKNGYRKSYVAQRDCWALLKVALFLELHRSALNG
jgi:hypothetical protein